VLDLDAWCPLAFLSTLVACNAGLYQGPDRPDDPNAVGPPPPAVFHCADGARRSVERRDGGGARLVYALGNGEVICSTEDRNGNGMVDTWVRLDHGRVVEEVTVPEIAVKLDAGSGGK
jgi:hypothetical protein